MLAGMAELERQDRERRAWLDAEIKREAEAIAAMVRPLTPEEQRERERKRHRDRRSRLRACTNNEGRRESRSIKSIRVPCPKCQRPMSPLRSSPICRLCSDAIEKVVTAERAA